MNTRAIFREYAKSKGAEAKSFDRIVSEWYDQDALHTLDNNGKPETTTISYKEMVRFIMKNFKMKKI